MENLTLVVIEGDDPVEILTQDIGYLRQTLVLLGDRVGAASEMEERPQFAAPTPLVDLKSKIHDLSEAWNQRLGAGCLQGSHLFAGDVHMGQKCLCGETSWQGFGSVQHLERRDDGMIVVQSGGW